MCPAAEAGLQASWLSIFFFTLQSSKLMICVNYFLWGTLLTGNLYELGLPCLVKTIVSNFQINKSKSPEKDVPPFSRGLASSVFLGVFIYLHHGPCMWCVEQFTVNRNVCLVRTFRSLSSRDNRAYCHLMPLAPAHLGQLVALCCALFPSNCSRTNNWA